MKKAEAPEQINLTQEEAEGLKDKVRSQSLSDKDIKLLIGLISFTLWLQKQLQLAKLTIHRLKGLFGIKTEKKSLKKMG